MTCALIILANSVTIGVPGVVVKIDKRLFCWRKQHIGGIGPRAVGVWRNLSWNAYEEPVPGGSTSMQCSHTPANTAAVCAARLNRNLKLLAGLQHMTAVGQPAERLHKLCLVLLEEIKALQKSECGTASARTQLDAYLIEYMWHTQFGGNPS